MNWRRCVGQAEDRKMRRNREDEHKNNQKNRKILPGIYLYHPQNTPDISLLHLLNRGSMRDIIMLYVVAIPSSMAGGVVYASW